MAGGRLWHFCCSLKLAIVLASAATVVMIGGSLLVPAYPRLFGPMDQLSLLQWWHTLGAGAPLRTWWVPAAGGLIVLLGFNTVCCFIDWLLHLRSRWRKTGEYLIHLGFVLLLAGYLWSSVAGVRSEGVRILAGQTVPVPGAHGHYLRLETVAPVLVQGRPVDVLATLELLRGDAVVARKSARTNHPLLHRSLLAIPVSFGQQVAQGPRGPLYRPYALLTLTHDPGMPLAAAGAAAMLAGVACALFSFYAKRRRGDRPDIG